jgi:hypothetical protein
VRQQRFGNTACLGQSTDPKALNLVVAGSSPCEARGMSKQESGHRGAAYVAKATLQKKEDGQAECDTARLDEANGSSATLKENDHQGSNVGVAATVRPRWCGLLVWQRRHKNISAMQDRNKDPRSSATPRHVYVEIEPTERLTLCSEAFTVELQEYTPSQDRTGDLQRVRLTS